MNEMKWSFCSAPDRDDKKRMLGFFVYLMLMVLIMTSIVGTHLPLNIEGLGDEEIIASYFYCGFSYSEILSFLQAYHDIDIGYRQLQRRLKRLGLRRHGAKQTVNFEAAYEAIEKELRNGSKDMGYRSMHLRIRQKYHIITSRECVMIILRHLDPVGVYRRRQRRLHRREYSVPGPNYIWHIDGWDKLKPFWLCVHGCIDGYSRNIMWLKVSSTNNDPYVACEYFAKCIQFVKGVPTKIRSDRGTENVNVELMQKVLRTINSGDPVDASTSFLYGKSTSNQRIESWWSKFGILGMNKWIQHFKELEKSGIIDTSKEIDMQCIIFCYITLLREELEQIVTLWNTHYIRKSRNQPYGRPNTMYYLPGLSGGENCLKPISSRHLEILSENLTCYVPACKEFYRELFSLVMDEEGKTLPKTLAEAEKLLVYILDSIDQE